MIRRPVKHRVNVLQTRMSRKTHGVRSTIARGIYQSTQLGAGPNSAEQIIGIITQGSSAEMTQAQKEQSRRNSETRRGSVATPEWLWRDAVSASPRYARLRQFLQRAPFELSDSLPGQVELLANLAQRHGRVGP